MACPDSLAMMPPVINCMTTTAAHAYVRMRNCCTHVRTHAQLLHTRAHACTTAAHTYVRMHNCCTHLRTHACTTAARTCAYMHAQLLHARTHACMHNCCTHVRTHAQLLHTCTHTCTTATHMYARMHNCWTHVRTHAHTQLLYTYAVMNACMHAHNCCYTHNYCTHLQAHVQTHGQYLHTNIRFQEPKCSSVTRNRRWTPFFKILHKHRILQEKRNHWIISDSYIINSLYSILQWTYS